MPLPSCLYGPVRTRGDARKCLKLVREMGLVRVSARGRDLRPIRFLCASVCHRQNVLESPQTAVALGRYPGCGRKQLDETLGAVAGPMPDVLDGGHLRLVEFAERICDSRVHQ